MKMAVLEREKILWDIKRLCVTYTWGMHDEMFSHEEKRWKWQKKSWQDDYDRQDSQTNKMGQNSPVLWPLFDHVSECYLMFITVSSLSCGYTEYWPELWLIYQQIQIKMR